MDAFIEGFFLQASLILALGAQNLFVLDSGLRKRRHQFVAAVCTLCDGFLIALGVLGAASVFVAIPKLKIAFGAVGVLFLLYYGVLKLREQPRIELAGSQGPESVAPLATVLGQTLAFSLLNPHCYLDTLVLIGGYSAQFESVSERAFFGSGAIAFSIIWFFGLANFAAAMSRHMHNAKVMRSISVVSGIVLVALSIKLGMDVLEWHRTS